MNQLGCMPKTRFVNVASCMGLMFVWGAVPYNVMTDLEVGFGEALAPAVISFYPLFVTC